VVNGNCAPASHGETLPGDPEIIGSSSGNVAAPRFTLARGPLAYVPADNPRGYAPALEVRVNERRYDEVPMLYGQPAAARTYTVRQVAGKSEVQFASRLPRGTYNVTARYRTGGGTAGLLGAGRLTSLISPVLGVGSATNPLATEGGSDAVTIDQLREAAPRYVRTLDRVVSLSDFEAFASDYRGIGKAMASELHDGMRALVLLTVADSAMGPPPAGSDILTDLADALATSAVPGRKVIVQGFADYVAVLEVKLASDSALPRERVEAAVRAALAARFGREEREFGRDLHMSELLAVIQEVPGVHAALVSKWQRALADPFTPQTGAGEDTRRLRCPGVALDHLAGLLSIDPDHVAFKELDA
jgi:predicted phage baseplate assembly protein